MRTYPCSGFRFGGTSECILVPVFVPGEHPPKPPYWKTILLAIPENRRLSQKTEDVAQKTAGNRRYGSVTSSPSPQARPYQPLVATLCHTASTSLPLFSICSLCMPISPHLYPSLSLSESPSLSLHTLSLSLSISLFLFSLCLYIYRDIHIYIYISLSLSLCLSLHISLPTTVLSPLSLHISLHLSPLYVSLSLSLSISLSLSARLLSLISLTLFFFLSLLLCLFKYLLVSVYDTMSLSLSLSPSLSLFFFSLSLYLSLSLSLLLAEYSPNVPKHSSASLVFKGKWAQKSRDGWRVRRRREN